MFLNAELIISVAAAVLGLLVLIFIVDWRYFCDWVVIFLYKCVLDSLWGTAVVNTGRIEFPYRQLPQFFKMSLLFDFWIFPILCVIYNQLTRKRGIRRILCYALLFSAGVTIIEYPMELYTNLIEYNNWDCFTSFYTMTITFLSSKAFFEFYRWGCEHFSSKGSMPKK